MIARTVQLAVLIAMSAMAAQWFFGSVYGHVAASIATLAQTVLGGG